ncbi:MAG TPA: M23 family metallopeptidase, partial [Ruminiclostridium sp.]
MAISPTLVKVAIQALSTKDGRKIVLLSILGPIVLLLLIISLFAYVLSAPFQWLADTFDLSSSEKTTVQNAQAQYKNYIKPENRQIDRGGFFIYPTEGTIGSRGFSSIPVPHPVLVGVSRPHWGQDFNTQWHSNIYAIADGQVVDLGINEETGMYITIYHNVNGKMFYTRYLHLSSIHALPDSEVKQGYVIASEGGQPDKKDSQPYDMYPGTSSVHHLHFEVREGSSYSSAVPVDPKIYINPIPVKISFSASGCSNSDSDG